MKALRQERHQTLKEKAEARQLDDQIFQPSLAVGEVMREAWSEHQSFDFIPEEEDLGAVVDMYDKARTLSMSVFGRTTPESLGLPS